MAGPTSSPAADISGDAALAAEGLVRRFGARRAVDGVSLTLRAGDCLALFGPNGAGKTTLLRMLGGLLKPGAGRTTIHGHQVPGDAETRRLVGIISHHTLLYTALTARENVRFAAECHGVIDADRAAEEALAQLQVLDRADVAVRALSRGLQQRVSIARALVHGPRLVLLDEPYTGLDDVGARALTVALETLKASGATLVLVTHNLAEGLTLASRAAVMMNGKVVHMQDVRDVPIDVDAFAARYRQLLSAPVERTA